VSRFDDAVAHFTGILKKCRQPGLTPADAMNQFYGWMGQVQRLLSLANQDLAQQLNSLRADGVDTLEAVSDFATYQNSMAEVLDEIGGILKGCTTVQALLAAEGRLNECLKKLEAAGNDLGALLDEEEEEPGNGPLPEDVAECLDRMEEAMQHLVHYAENREHQDLLELSAQLDLAKAALDKFLQADD